MRSMSAGRAGWFHYRWLVRFASGVALLAARPVWVPGWQVWLAAVLIGGEGLPNDRLRTPSRVRLWLLMREELLQTTNRGLYCKPGDFYVDPWSPVERAVITHAHSDHSCPGCGAYLSTGPCRDLLQARLGEAAKIEQLDYGQVSSINGIRVSFHPAGHILGSAQVRVENLGEVWVVSGDYKLEPDPTCKPFEPVRCHRFITESTFGLPVFRWPDQKGELEEVRLWWSENQRLGKASVIFVYSLGKAQRLLAGLDSFAGPIFTHGAVERMNEIYRSHGIRITSTIPVGVSERNDWSGALIVAPPWAAGSSWIRRFGNASTAFASGWMRLRGMKRRRAVDRGFVISDHADWDDLNEAVEATGAARVLVTHGYTSSLAGWLRGRGKQAEELPGFQYREADEEQRKNRSGDTN